MMRTSLSVMALLVASCAYHSPHSAPVPQTRFGPAENLSLRITKVGGLDIDYIIDHPAYVVAIRVTDPQDIEVISPVYGDGRSQAGHHYLRDGGAWPAFEWSEVEETSQIGCYSDGQSCRYTTSRSSMLPLPQGPNGGYWIVIVSNVPTTAADLSRSLGLVERSDTSVVNLVKKIPQAVIASRTTDWAAYYAAFGDTKAP